VGPRFWQRVVLLQEGERLLPHEPFAGEMVADALREKGIDVRTGAKRCLFGENREP